jgi:hypothetical protein
MTGDATVAGDASPGRSRRIWELRFAAVVLAIGLLSWIATGFPIGAPEFVAAEMGQMVREAVWALTGQFIAGTALLIALALLCAPATPPWVVRVLDYCYYGLAAAGVVLLFVSDSGTRWEAQKAQRVPELRDQIKALQATIDKLAGANATRLALRDRIPPQSLATLEAEAAKQHEICGLAWQPRRIELKQASATAAPVEHGGLAAELQACARSVGLTTMLHAAKLAETDPEQMPRLTFVVGREIDAAAFALKSAGVDVTPFLNLITWHDAEVALREKRALLDEYNRVKVPEQDARSLTFLRFVRYEWWVLVALGVLSLKLTKTTMELFRLTRDTPR